MDPQKIILFYKFTPLADPEAIRLWQRTLCEELGLKGRILISPHGINGTLGGDMTSVAIYIKKTKAYQPFKSTDFKWSEATGNEFPRLVIKVRDEVVSFGAPQDLEVDENGVVGGGQHLSPEQLHELVERRGDEVVFLDGRNAFEAKIGKFKNALVPRVATSRDFVKEIDAGAFDHLQDQPVVTYCTGGIRCEVLSTLLRKRGFSEVYQLDGGILRYGEKYGDRGLWEGSLYLFDARMHHEFSEDVVTLGRCERCDGPTHQFYNCANLLCRKLILLCATCAVDNLSTNCRPEHAEL